MPLPLADISLNILLDLLSLLLESYYDGIRITIFSLVLSSLSVCHRRDTHSPFLFLCADVLPLIFNAHLPKFSFWIPTLISSSPWPLWMNSRHITGLASEMLEKIGKSRQWAEEGWEEVWGAPWGKGGKYWKCTGCGSFGLWAGWRNGSAELCL